METDPEPRPLRGPRLRRPGVRVSVLLVVVTLLPLIGSGRFVANELRAADRVDGVSDEVTRTVDRALAWLDLRTALLQERTWQIIIRGLEDIGFAPEIAQEISGVDPEGERSAAAAAVDEALLDLDDVVDIGTRLDRLRSGELSIDDVRIGYDDLAADITVSIDDELRELLVSAASSGNGARLANAVQVLTAMADAQRAASSQLVAYFAARFGDLAGIGIGSVSREQLVGGTALYERASRDLSRLELSEAAEAGWRRILLDPGNIRFTSRVEEGIIDITREHDGTATTVDLFSQLDAASEAFIDGTARVEQHRQLLVVAAEAVRAEADALAAAADEQVRSALLWLGLLVASALTVALLVGSFIVRPTRRLAAGAEMIQSGAIGHRIPVRGPTELRDATQALNNAAATLALVERQAHQLATSELEPGEVTQAAPGALGETMRSAIEGLAHTIAERERLRAALAHEASHDGLTGLLNRTSVLDRLDEAVARSSRSGELLAVMFIDLDRFKSVNDELGHPAGDRVLRETADRLRATVRRNDHVGRLGGDEFVVVAEPVDGIEEARTLATRIVEELAMPVPGLDDVTIGASIGVAVDDGRSADSEALLASADRAVYSAKAAGRGTVHVARPVDLWSIDDQPIRRTP